ncbi:MAG TPA: hydrogenase formation protein HypD [Lachnospiraceae bacterium]|nr:hydrogenase formation protein HypD [Lachnospiraceae bacterium]
MEKSKAEMIVRSYDGRPLRIMEVCGTHTHAIFRCGIRKILPENIRLISGPGCPVCVTETGYIDEALYLALEKGAVITTFGDLVRVPGTEMNLAAARAKGAEIKIVYSPLDAYVFAKEHPEKKVVFLSVGFETTAPASCLAVKKAKADGLKNFSLLVANKTMDNAYRVLKGSADAFLYPGHVSTITGTAIYDELKNEGISGAVCGFTSDEILTALAVIITRSKEGKPFSENCYLRVVRPEGSPIGRKLIEETMEPCDAVWRGIGNIPGSGLTLRSSFSDYDARLIYGVPVMHGRPNPACRCGDVLMGRIRPKECPVFGKVCTPEHPIGACMVSSEGTCSAYYKYDWQPDQA